MDGKGICGFIFHYVLLSLLLGNALIVFLYLWRNNRLDMDEEAKYHIFDDE